jgi:hypothetical protein
VRQALAAGDLQTARSLVFHWLEAYGHELQAPASRQALRLPELWSCLADVVERSSDQYLLERFWQRLDGVCPPQERSVPGAALPLLGVPILNRFDLLEQLLASLDHPVHTLAIVDNSGGPGAVRRGLDQLERSGHPLVERIAVARGFGNQGVAASWNQILLAFPGAGVALLANNDVRFSAGCMAAALAQVDAHQAQWLPLLPEPDSFAAFLITAKAWDRVGLFDEAFYPAYCEDLEFRDRLRADPLVQQLDGGAFHGAMAALNREGSQTIASDAALAAFNAHSFALNRLWYLSHRRLRHDPRGRWVRRWLAEWKD